MSSHDTSGKPVLRLNLDETSVSYFYEHSQGTIARHNEFLREGQKPEANVGLAKRRMCITHIALICDDAGFQPYVPQVLVANEHLIPLRDMDLLRGCLPNNVFLLRQASAWNNTAIMRFVVQHLALAIATHRPGHHPILLVDCARCHLKEEVTQVCRSLGIYLCIVPARLTWLLQPLDTHGFSRYKHFMKVHYQEARTRSTTGDVSLLDWLRTICLVIRFVLQGIPWRSAFDENGFAPGQSKVSKYIIDEAALEQPIVLSTAPFSREDYAVLLPRRMKFQVAAFRPPEWRALLALPAPPARLRARPVRDAIESAPLPLDDVPPGPIVTRSMSRALSAVRDQGPPTRPPPWVFSGPDPPLPWLPPTPQTGGAASSSTVARSSEPTARPLAKGKGKTRPPDTTTEARGSTAPATSQVWTRSRSSERRSIE